MEDILNNTQLHLQGSNPDEAFARVASNLDNKDVAKNFCEHTEEILKEMGEKGAYIYNPNLIGVYAEIVEHHPEMAKTCNDLVNMVAELDGSPDGKIAGAAVEYFDKVDRTDGVDSSQKSLARIKSNSWRKKQEKAKENSEEATVTQEYKRYKSKYYRDNILKTANQLVKLKIELPDE